MTLQQREPFENLAKKAAPNPRIPKASERLLSETTMGSSNTITEMVEQSFMKSSVETQEYYFIAANVFCKTFANKYYPAELSLLKFTLQDGVTDAFHTYVDPEKIPIGYRFEAISMSNDTHQLPIPPDAIGEKNFVQILLDMNEFIGISSMESAQEFIPLFTLEENIPMIQSICQDFRSIAAANCRYEILSINRLLFDLKNSATRNIDGTRRVEQFKSINDATAVLDQERYLYLNRIACQFHEINDRSNYCCLSAVKRWAYAISENICNDLNIRLVAGKHFPTGVETPIEHDYTNNEASTAAGAGGFSGVDRHQQFDSNATVTASFSTLDDLKEVSIGLGRGRRTHGMFDEQNYQRRSFGRGRSGRRDAC